MAKDKRKRNKRASASRNSAVVTGKIREGQRTVLEPGPGIKLYLNGARIAEPEEAENQDRTIVEDVDKAQEVRLLVQISPDGLEAKARFEFVSEAPACSEGADLPQPPQLMLATGAKAGLSPIGPDLIEDALRKKGIFVGIDKKAIKSLIAGGVGKPTVVARGRPPTAGKDAQIKLRFTEDCHDNPVVKAGDELAVKEPLLLGKPGLSVTGKPIAPTLPQDIELRAGKGAKISDGGLRAIASQSGRPVYSRGKIEVFPLLVAEPTLDLTTGNIEFDGDVMVKGDVEETIAVHARGDIKVMGNVTCANLIAGGQVHIYQSAIGGVVRSGSMDVVHARMLDAWESLAQGLEECATVLTQMSKRPEARTVTSRQGWGRALSKLLETKFPHLPSTVNDLAAAYREVPNVISTETGNMLSDFQQKVSRQGIQQLTGIDQIWGLVKQAKQLIRRLKESSAKKVSITANYVQKVRVEASGDIILHGKGCYQSYLYAGRCIEIRGHPGIVWGGVVQASKKIVAKQAGSEAENPTLLKVDAEGIIIVDQVYPNVIVQVGEVSHRFRKLDKDIKARKDEKGVFLLH